jgi:hypothetical protein
MAIPSAFSFLLIYVIFVCPFSSRGYAGCSNVARVAQSRSIQLSGDRPLFITTGYYNTTYYIQYTTTMIRHHAPKKHIRKKQLLILAVTEEQEGGGGSAGHKAAPHDDFIQFHPFPPFFYPSTVGIGINGVMLGRMSCYLSKGL